MRLPSSLVLAGCILATTSLAHADDGAALVTPNGDARAMRSPALLGGGIALGVVGTFAVPFGVLFLAIPHDQPMCMGCGIDYTSRDVTGAVFLAGGLAAIAASIPMMVLGAKRVPIAIGSGPRGTAGLTLQATF